jgi:hypothetical protein
MKTRLLVKTPYGMTIILTRNSTQWRRLEAGFTRPGGTHRGQVWYRDALSGNCPTGITPNWAARV